MSSSKAPRNGGTRVREQGRDFSAAAPMFILVFLWVGVMLSLQTRTFTAFYVVLTMCAFLLGGAAWWFVTSYQLPRRTLRAMWGALALIALTWGWQRVLFLLMVPPDGLSYGYFLTPEGHSAGILVLQGPTVFGASVCALLAALSARAAWRAGARWSVVALLSWWLALFAVFMLPSMYLDGQGNATIFI
jgi:hypothetical protein